MPPYLFPLCASPFPIDCVPNRNLENPFALARFPGCFLSCGRTQKWQGPQIAQLLTRIGVVSPGFSGPVIFGDFPRWRYGAPNPVWRSDLLLGLSTPSLSRARSGVERRSLWRVCLFSESRWVNGFVAGTRPRRARTSTSRMSRFNSCGTTPTCSSLPPARRQRRAGAGQERAVAATVDRTGGRISGPAEITAGTC
jgi:hypothetical protein